MAPRYRYIECTAYCSCGYCCCWEWGIKLPGNRYLALAPSPWPFRLRKRGQGMVNAKIPIFAKYWTSTVQKGGHYQGLTANGQFPAQSRPPIFSAKSLSEYKKIPGRILLFPWRFLPRTGTIAADTVYFPMGTKMLVPGYGWGVVDDKGSAIKGPARVDLYHHSHKDALQFGRRKVKVLVVPPGESVIDGLHLPGVVRAIIKPLYWAKCLLF